MKPSKVKPVVFILLLAAICLIPFVHAKAQVSSKPPTCSMDDIRENSDMTDEYDKAITKACEGLNNAIYDSTRYFLEKAIFFKGWLKIPKTKLQQLKDYLGMPEFKKLVCFCENYTPPNLSDNGSAKEPDTITTPIYEHEPADLELDEATKSDLQEKALVKCHQFADYNKTITDPNSSQELVNNAIESSIALFVNEDAQIEVSSKNRKEPTSYRVRKYLQMLSALNSFYDKIEILGSKFYIVNRLRKGPDGNYYGVVSFEQSFTGYRDNKIAYTDITRKNIIVMIRKINKMEEGSVKIVWDVLLKEVKVAETL